MAQAQSATAALNQAYGVLFFLYIDFTTKHLTQKIIFFSKNKIGIDCLYMLFFAEKNYSQVHALALDAHFPQFHVVGLRFVHQCFVVVWR
jgi:hypothetical protein